MATKAKTGEFKNKITKAQEDLFKSLDTEKEKRSKASSKIVQALNKQGKANVKTLNSLNKEYLDHCQKNDEELQTFIDKVKKINDDLELGIKTYNETYIVDDEQANLISQKDKVVAPLKTRFKREIHDINIKIDRIDKELKETLEDRENKSNEEADDYKEKLLDFEKRKRFDLNKIQNNTIKSYDELQKKLLLENKRAVIKKYKKDIKEIRHQGLVEEQECLFQYFDDQKQFELDYAKHEYDVACENSSLTKEYNTRIENTKFDRSMIEYNFQKEFDRYDNEVIHNLNAVNKDMELKQNGMKEVLYKDIYNSSIEEFSNEQKKHDDELKVINNVYEEIEKLDNKQIDDYLDLDSKDLSSIDNDLKIFRKNINLTLNFYITQITNIYHTYFKDLFKKEEHFLTTLLINSVEREFLNEYSYQEYVDKVNQLFVKFNETETEAITKFEEILNNLLNNLLVQVEVFINGISDVNNQIHAQVTLYNDNMRTLLKEAKEAGINFYSNIYNGRTNAVNTKLSDNQTLYDNRCKELAQEKVDFENEFNDREAKVKMTENSQEATYATMYEGYKKSRDDEITKINQTYDEEVAKYEAIYNEKVSQIEERFANDRADVEKDYKVKMGLL